MRGSPLLCLLALTLAPLASGRAVTPSKAKDESLRPRLKLTRSFEPRVKVRRKMSLFGTTLTVGADYHVNDQFAVRARPPAHRHPRAWLMNASRAPQTFETTWRDKWVGGELALSDLSQLQWTKAWFFPGLSDAATRVEARCAVDLRTGQPDLELKLGLRRRFAKPGISLVHDIPLDGKRGHAKLSVGSTITVPEELQLTGADVAAAAKAKRDGKEAEAMALLKQAYFDVDIDRLDLLLEY